VRVTCQPASDVLDAKDSSIIKAHIENNCSWKYKWIYMSADG